MNEVIKTRIFTAVVNLFDDKWIGNKIASRYLIWVIKAGCKESARQLKQVQQRQNEDMMLKFVQRFQEITNLKTRAALMNAYQ